MTARDAVAHRFEFRPGATCQRLLIAFVAILMVGASGCTSQHNDPQQPSATSDVGARPDVQTSQTVDVGPKAAPVITIPGIVTVTVPAGAFDAAGSMTVTQTTTELPKATGARMAGQAVDITFEHTKPTKALTLAFDVTHKEPSELPAVLHRSDTGNWNIVSDARIVQHKLVIHTRNFSPNIPVWINPKSWWSGIGGSLAEDLGGRTSPVRCSGPPRWFHVDSVHSDLVHVCATSESSGGETLAAVKIKSNRGVTVEVTVPGRPRSVSVTGQPEAWRRYLASLDGTDPDETVLLPAGQTLTVTYPRGSTKAPFQFFVSGATPRAAVDTVSRELIEKALDAATSEYGPIFVSWLELKCVTSASFGSAGAVFSLSDLSEFLGCWRDQAAGLKQEKSALKVASTLRDKGLKIGEVDADKLLATARNLQALGWLIELWPVYEVTYGNVLDKISELLTDGTSAHVTFNFDPLPTQDEGAVLGPGRLGSDIRLGMSAELAEKVGAIGSGNRPGGCGQVSTAKKLEDFGVFLDFRLMGDAQSVPPLQGIYVSGVAHSSIHTATGVTVGTSEATLKEKITSLDTGVVFDAGCNKSSVLVQHAGRYDLVFVLDEGRMVSSMATVFANANGDPGWNPPGC